MHTFRSAYCYLDLVAHGHQHTRIYPTFTSNELITDRPHFREVQQSKDLYSQLLSYTAVKGCLAEGFKCPALNQKFQQYFKHLNINLECLWIWVTSAESRGPWTRTQLSLAGSAQTHRVLSPGLCRPARLKKAIFFLQFIVYKKQGQNMSAL